MAKKLSLFLIGLVGLVLVVVFFIFQDDERDLASISPDSQSASLSDTPLNKTSSTLTKEYSNSTYKFSLKIPENFKVREILGENSRTVLLENEKGKENQGIQILISPFDDIKILTVNMIHKDLPDLKISEPQPVEIGNNHKGLAFKSDNPAFGGVSREVWFVFHGNMYQVSTYDKFNDLLKEVFGTWKFTQ